MVRKKLYLWGEKKKGGIMDVAIANAGDRTISLYWNFLRTLNRTVRLNLAARLTASVAEEEAIESNSVSDPTRDMLDKYYGAWVGKETAADTMYAIREHSTSRQPITF